MAVVTSTGAKNQQQNDYEYQHSLFLSSVLNLKRDRPGASLFVPACYQEHDAAHERHCACDGRQGYTMCLVARSVNGSDVDDLFPGGVRKTSPRKTEQTKHNQDHPKRLIHGGLLRRR
jgi:hypothetical protein